jgi:hypothetical protein
MHENRNQNAQLSHLVVSIQAGVLAFVFAVIGGLGLFLVTVWLLIKGGPHVNSGQMKSIYGVYRKLNQSQPISVRPSGSKRYCARL